MFVVLRDIRVLFASTHPNYQAVTKLIRGGLGDATNLHMHNITVLWRCGVSTGKGTGHQPSVTPVAPLGWGGRGKDNEPMLPPCWCVNGQRSSSSLVFTPQATEEEEKHCRALQDLQPPTPTLLKCPQVRPDLTSTTKPWLVPSRESGEDDDDDGEQPPEVPWLLSGSRTGPSDPGFDVYAWKTSQRGSLSLLIRSIDIEWAIDSFLFKPEKDFIFKNNPTVKWINHFARSRERNVSVHRWLWFRLLQNIAGVLIVWKAEK